MTEAPLLETRGAHGRIVAAAALGTMLAPLNSTMIVVALPRMITALELTARQAGYLLTAYLIVMASSQVLAGQLGDRIDRRTLVLTGLAGFGLTALASLAHSFPWLLGFRVLQALCAAVVIPNLAALVRQAVPGHLRGRSFGLIGGATSLAAAVGPLVGGLFVEVGGWRSIFLANLLLVVPAFLLTRGLRLPAPKRSESGRPAQSSPWPVLREAGFLAAGAGIALSNLSMYTVLVALPLSLSQQGWSEGQTGLALMTMSAAMALFAPAGGYLADRVGRRRTAMGGMGMVTVGLLLLTLAGRFAGGADLILGLALAGTGLGLSSSALQTAAAESAGAEAAGAAAGFASTARYLGSITSTGLITWLLAGGGSLTPAFAIAAGAGALGALSVIRLTERPR